MRYETDKAKRGQADSATFRLAQFLGVFSIMLGIGELIWGGTIAEHTGLGGYEWLVRVYGAREILNGILILFSKDPTPWIWLRVIGDGLDAATLIWGYTRDPSHVMGVIADIYCAIKLSSESKRPLAPVKDYSDRSGI
jgi:hypothetical protein